MLWHWKNTLKHLNISKEILKKQGIDVCILKLCRIKPIDTKAVEIAHKYENVFFFEESMLKGGIAETFCFMLLDNDFNGKYYSKAIDEIYV